MRPLAEIEAEWKLADTHRGPSGIDDWYTVAENVPDLLAELRRMQAERDTIVDLVLDGLWIDGAHHKQWHLQQIRAALGIDADQNWDEGIPP